MASNFVNGINILDTTNSSGINSGGSLNVRGGASFTKDIYIGGNVNISGTTTAFSDNMILINQNPLNSTDTGFLFERYSEDISNNKKYSAIIYSETNDQYVFAYLENEAQRGSITTNGFIGIQSENLTLHSTQNSSGVGSGGTLNVFGGTSISKDLHVGGNIYNNGNIGIGTSSPNKKLDVVAGGGLILSDSGAGVGGITNLLTVLGGTTGNNNVGSSILIGGGAAHYSIIRGIHTASGLTQLDFGTCSSAGDPTIKWRIEGNGDFRQMTDSKVQFRANTGDGDGRININDLTGTAISFYIGTTKVGSITLSGSSTAYNTSSDYRLKENVISLENALDRLIQIPVHRFNFISVPDVTYDGFLAHEVQAIVPEAVTGEKDALDEEGNIKAQGIDQSKLVPLLTAALKEVNTKLQNVETFLKLKFPGEI